jgi:hypothetical protein
LLERRSAALVDDGRRPDVLVGVPCSERDRLAVVADGLAWEEEGAGCDVTWVCAGPEPACAGAAGIVAVVVVAAGVDDGDAGAAVTGASPEDGSGGCGVGAAESAGDGARGWGALEGTELACGWVAVVRGGVGCGAGWVAVVGGGVGCGAGWVAVVGGGVGCGAG